jgi:hypothetical protein
LEVFPARIPQRIGYARPWRNFFLTQTVASRAEAVKMHKRSVAEIKQLVAADVNQRQNSAGHVSANTATSAHQIHEYLHVVATLGANPEPLAPLLFVTVEEIDAAKKKFGLDQNPGPLFGLNPGAEYGPAKRWPADRFIAAAQRIQSKINCTWILFGGKNDEVISAQIQSAIGNRQSAIPPSPAPCPPCARSRARKNPPPVPKPNSCAAKAPPPPPIFWPKPKTKKRCLQPAMSCWKPCDKAPNLKKPPSTKRPSTNEIPSTNLQPPNLRARHLVRGQRLALDAWTLDVGASLELGRLEFGAFLDV